MKWAKPLPACLLILTLFACKRDAASTVAATPPMEEPETAVLPPRFLTEESPSLSLDLSAATDSGPCDLAAASWWFAQFSIPAQDGNTPIDTSLLDPLCRTIPVASAHWPTETKRQLAVAKARDFEPGRDDWDAWAAWMLTLDLPLDCNHPLAALGARAGDFEDRPEWLLRLPAGKARNLAIANYYQALELWEPDIAFTWLTQIRDAATRQHLKELLSTGYRPASRNDRLRNLVRDPVGRRKREEPGPGY